MARLKVFLDANILFSAALGGPSFRLLWEIARRGRVQLLTSPFCHHEAAENLARKRPDALLRLTELLDSVSSVPGALSVHGGVEHPSVGELPEKDRPVLAAAIASQADILVTGDLRQFGPLMDREDLPLKVRTLRAFLIEGP